MFRDDEDRDISFWVVEDSRRSRILTVSGLGLGNLGSSNPIDCGGEEGGDRF